MKKTIYIFFVFILISVFLTIFLDAWIKGCFFILRYVSNARDWRYSTVDDKAVLKEYLSLKTSYSPYVIWKKPQHSGKYINIDTSGERAVPQSVKGGEKIFVFGGSTVLGWGVTDNCTIPAYIAEKAKAEVHNLGCSGYVLEQNIIDLILHLQKGNIPDTAIFYEGINDVWLLVQKTSSDKHLQYLRISNMFNVRNHFFHGFYLLKRMFEERKRFKDAPDIGINQLTSLRIHFENSLKILDVLSKKYGFKYKVFLQPSIFNCKDDKRKKFILTHYSKGLTNIYDSAYKELRKIKSNKFVDISLSVNLNSSHFFDYAHVNSMANKKISKVILEKL